VPLPECISFPAPVIPFGSLYLLDGGNAQPEVRITAHLRLYDKITHAADRDQVLARAGLSIGLAFNPARTFSGKAGSLVIRTPQALRMSHLSGRDFLRHHFVIETV
jgi:hypothetical protein